MSKEQDILLRQPLSSLRAKLSDKRGREYWRSLEQLAESDEFQRIVQNEFPSSPFDAASGLSRRHFLQLMAGSLALAGLGACTSQPEEKIVPYVDAPEEIVPGKPLFFATAFVLGGYATGVLAESHMGRPTKIEGNPDHPASLGATNTFAQASILEMYDPERSKVVLNRGSISTWESFLGALREEVEGQRIKDGAGIRILTETVTSPTLASQLQEFLQQFPSAKWHQYEPCNRDNVRAGARLAFGEFVDCYYDLEQADVVLSLDADLLDGMPGSLAYCRQFSAKRNPENGVRMNRLYMVESTPTTTGTLADHRLSVTSVEVAHFAVSLAREVGVEAPDGDTFSGKRNWITALARDLKRNKGRSVVVAGEQQAPEVHYLAHAINAALNNIGKTVHYIAPVEPNPVMQTDSLRELSGEMNAGQVDLLLFFGVNPVFDAPADLNFSDALAKVKTRVHLGVHENETSELSHWHIPQSHYLESWGDARAFDGTVTIIQPLIAPLYASKSSHEIMSGLLGRSGESGYDSVRQYWRKQIRGNFERAWQIALHDGVIAGSASPRKTPKLRNGLKLTFPEVIASESSLELNFRPDGSVWDGRFANNGWLQELPKPLTKLTWDNAALISPTTADRLELQNGDLVELSAAGRSASIPIWITPGHPVNAVSVTMGYGRRRVGKVGKDTGFDVYPLRTTEGQWRIDGVSLKKTGRRISMASTQDHGSMEGRDLVRSTTLKEYLEQPEKLHEESHDPGPEMSLYPQYPYDGYAWGLAVDLNTCVGCNACTIACQAENNISVVGKSEVLNGREMHWIRVDRYYAGDLAEPEDVLHQPVMCMHCENAPCEVVCPVAATTHSPEGLNEMTYNRCVGTRYCANNCPYKVRRFNFYKYADYETESLKLMRNPDVTVRFRGVMEKCSYCVQRISHARINAEKEDREIRDGDIVTACQQVCPADAIVFGNINDKNSRVAKLKAEERNYGILTELGTRPRTSYLAKIKNPNPEISEA